MASEARKITIPVGWPAAPQPPAFGAPPAGEVRRPDWKAFVTGSQAYAPQPFVPPPLAVDHGAMYRAAARRAPLWPWALLILVSTWLVVNVESPALQVAAALPSLGAILFAARVPRRRAAIRSALLEEARKAHEEEVERARAAHEEREEARRQAWQKVVALRARMSGALDDEDTATMAELVAAELRLQQAPLPVEGTVELPDIRTARLELALPPPGAAARALGVRAPGAEDEAVAAGAGAPAAPVPGYADLCAALALRLIRETFRILPVVEGIELFGRAGAPEGAAPGDGGGGDAEHRGFVALHLAMPRAALEKLDLDGVTPAEAIAALGGSLELDRHGRPRPVPGLTSTR